MQRLHASSLLAAGLMLLTVASYGQTPISSVPFIISAPGSYIVTKDLSYNVPNLNAITVKSSNVTIDFDSHSLVAGAKSQAIGVFIDFAANIQVKNGTISGFFAGISVDNSVGDIFEGMRLVGGAVAIEIGGNASSVLCKDNYIISAGTGIDCDGAYTQLSGNRITNASTGIQIDTGANGAGTRAYLDNNLICQCGYGVQVEGPNFTKLRFNTTLDCKTPFAGGTDVGISNN